MLGELAEPFLRGSNAFTLVAGVVQPAESATCDSLSFLRLADGADRPSSAVLVAILVGLASAWSQSFFAH